MKNVAFNLNTSRFVAAAAEGVVIVREQADLEKLETKVLVSMYNATRETPIKKFESRAAAIQRVSKMIAEHQAIPELKVEVKAAKVEATVKPAGVKAGVKTRAVDRIIDLGKQGSFTLEKAEKDLGIKQGCLRTHMSFINSHTLVFGGVKFVGNRKDKTYTMQAPKAA